MNHGKSSYMLYLDTIFYCLFFIYLFLSKLVSHVTCIIVLFPIVVVLALLRIRQQSLQRRP